jgi:FKBP-type peptidyl-prolyl cis-trans isomerase SlyD
MPVKKGDFIKLNYTGTMDGNIFDTTYEDVAKEAGIYNESASYEAVTISVGCHHVILGLDEEMEGKEIGDEGEVDISPERAFGEHDPGKVESFNKNSFREKPRKGVSIKIPDKGEGTVVDIIGNRVLVDFNHPFAGKTLHYNYRIEEEVTGVEEQVQGLIKLYAGREMELSFEDGVLTLMLPPGINFDRRWVMWRSRVVHEAFENIPDIDEILFKEVFKRPEKEETPGEEE